MTNFDSNCAIAGGAFKQPTRLPPLANVGELVTQIEATTTVKTAKTKTQETNVGKSQQK